METTIEVKKTPLFERHVQEGAKIVDFAGYKMPLQYKGIIEEHETVRTAAGLFDLTHMGELEIKGEWKDDLIQYLITNDVSKLEPGGVIYTLICNDKGGILDDALVYKMEDRYMLVVNASNVDKIYRWVIEKEDVVCGYKTRQHCMVVNKSDEIAIVAIQGPKSEEILQRITPVDLSEIKYYHFTKGKVLDTKAIISRTGYTGEDGFELYISNKDAIPIWDALMVEGQSFGIQPIGLGARDTLRLEAKYPLYGNELNEDRTPLDVGLKWAVCFDKCIYSGYAAINEAAADRPAVKLVGFEITKPGSIARKDSKVFNGEGEEIGVVTSGTYSPTLKKAIGLALVKRKGMKVGTPLQIEVRKKKVPAVIIKTPFYKGSVKMEKKSKED